MHIRCEVRECPLRSRIGKATWPTHKKTRGIKRLIAAFIGDIKMLFYLWTVSHIGVTLIIAIVKLFQAKRVATSFFEEIGQVRSVRISMHALKCTNKKPTIEI